MMGLRAAICLFSVLLTGIVTAGDGRQLVMVNAPYAPFVNDEDDPLGDGIDLDIAREALRHAGYTVVVKRVPWKRALTMLEYGEADFTTSISHTAQREDFLVFSVGYRESARYLFYTVKGSPLTIRSLQDLQGHSVGSTAGFFYPTLFLETPGIVINEGNDMSSTVRKLLGGRTELIIVNAIAGRWEIQQLGLEHRLQRQPFELSSAYDAPTYMAFSRKTRYTEALAALNAGLTRMKQDGSLSRIETRYLQTKSATDAEPAK